MKKIIYSLVIMIAAGSLFTSCIDTTVEPAGVNEMRVAKAEYLRALAELRKADAELQKAHATYVLALAQLEQANVAYRNAETEGKKLENELLALQVELQAEKNEAKKAELAAKIADLLREQELKEEEHKAAMATAEKNTATALETLRVALRDIAANAYFLTSGEALALNKAQGRYDEALEKYNDKVFEVLELERDLWNAQNTEKKYTLAYWENAVTAAEANALALTTNMLSLAALDTENQDAMYEEIKNFEDTAMFYEAAEKALEIEKSKYQNQHSICEGAAEWAKRVKNAIDSLPEVTDGPYPFFLNLNDEGKSIIKQYGWNNADPNNTVIKNFKTYVNTYYANLASNLDPEHAKFFNLDKGFGVAANIKDADFLLTGKETEVWDGSAEVELQNAVGGLKGIIATLKAQYVVENDDKSKEDDIKDKQTKLEAATKKYNDTYAIVKAGPEGPETATANAKKAMIAAQKGLAAALKSYKVGYMPDYVASQPDSLNLLSAIVTFAKAKDAYLGNTKTVLKYEDNLGQPQTIAIKDIKPNDLSMFRQIQIGADKTPLSDNEFSSIYGGKRYKVNAPYNKDQMAKVGTNDAFLKILSLLTETPATGDGQGSFDFFVANAETINFYQGNDPAALAALKITGIKPDGTVEGADFVAAPLKAYKQAVCDFWGVTVADYNKVKNYNVVDYLKANTFDDVVYFNGTNVAYNDNLAIIFNQLRPTGASAPIFNAYPYDVAKTNKVFGTADSQFIGSMLFKVFKAKFDLEVAKNTTANTAALKAIADIVDQLEADFTAYTEAWDAAVVAWGVITLAAMEKYEELTGYPFASEDASVMVAPTVVGMLDLLSEEELAQNLKDNISEGEFTFIGGQMLEWAKELLPEYPSAMFEFDEDIKSVQHQKAHYDKYVTDLKKFYAELMNIVNGTVKVTVYEYVDGVVTPVEKTITLSADDITVYVENYRNAIEQYMKDLAEDLEEANEAVELAEQNLERFKAGFEASQLDVADKTLKLAHAKEELEMLEIYLDTVKAEFDAIVAAYLSTNIE